MIIDVAVIYPITAIQRGSRKAKIFNVRDTVPVDIREITPEEVEIVFALEGGTSWCTYESSLYLQVGWREDTVAEAAAQPYGSNPFLVSTSGDFFCQAYAGDAPVELAFREIVSSGRADAIAAANVRAANVFLCGNKLLVPSRGPVFQVSSFGQGEFRSAPLVGINDLQPGTPGVEFGGNVGSSGVDYLTLSPGDVLRSRTALMDVMGEENIFDTIAIPDHPLLSYSLREENLAGALDGLMKVAETLSPWNLPTEHLEAYLRYTSPDFEPGEDAEHLVSILVSMSSLTLPRYAGIGAWQEELTERLHALGDILKVFRYPYQEPEPEIDWDFGNELDIVP